MRSCRACHCDTDHSVRGRCIRCYMLTRSSSLTPITYSMLSQYLTCRRKAMWRYERQLVRVGRDEGKLYLGRLVHECLELLITGQPLEAIRDRIEDACEGHQHDPELHRMWHLARAMMRGYYRRYGRDRESYAVLDTEIVFEVPIINPASGRPSRVHKLQGRIDGRVVLRDTNEMMLLEHKTASQVDGSYLDRLWTDHQSLLYVLAMRMLGYPVAGVVYNVICKAKLKQRQGETEDEYAIRKAALAAKSKSGKSNAKRRMGETDEEYQDRLGEWYSRPEAFHREVLYFEERRFAELQEELWILQQEISRSRGSDVWPRNPGACYRWGSPCAYYPLCSSGDSPVILAGDYETKIKHEELEG